MTRHRFQISKLRSVIDGHRWLLVLLASGAASVMIGLTAAEVLARVGGGQSYGGGGGGGALVYLLIRFLLWLTIELPLIGIPVDTIVIGIVIYWFVKPKNQSLSTSSLSVVAAPDAVATAVQQQQGVQRSFNQLRRFDPNFSEIIFIDFCYALYGRAHEARGR